MSLKKKQKNTTKHFKKDVEVRSSAIHGKGLFARRPIAAGTVLGRCTTKKSRGATSYTLWLGDDGDAVEVQCKFRYINHAKKANVTYYDDLTVVALTTIQSGEELLHDYGEDWE